VSIVLAGGWRGDIKMNQEQLKVLVSYYLGSPFGFPGDDRVFLPIQAGKALSNIDLNILGDDSGDNISEFNESFGEFTVWYWAWKNIKKYYPNLKYIGLAHYRRFIAFREKRLFENTILVKHMPPLRDYDACILSALERCDILQIKKQYGTHNRRMQFSYNHNSMDYLTLRRIVADLYPEDCNAFDYVFECTNGLTIPILACRYELFERYCEWLFPILFEARRRIDTSAYPAYQKRMVAFLAERLLDVWIYKNKLKTEQFPVYLMSESPLYFDKYYSVVFGRLVFGLQALAQNRRRLSVLFDKSGRHA
jgi:hypothetical protein